jgi:hypothetical protein
LMSVVAEPKKVLAWLKIWKTFKSAS